MRNMGVSSSSSYIFVSWSLMRWCRFGSTQHHNLWKQKIWQTATTAPFTEIIVDSTISVDRRAVSWELAPTLSMEVVGYNWLLKLHNWLINVRTTQQFSKKYDFMIRLQLWTKLNGHNLHCCRLDVLIFISTRHKTKTVTLETKTKAATLKTKTKIVKILSRDCRDETVSRDFPALSMINQQMFVGINMDLGSKKIMYISGA